MRLDTAEADRYRDLFKTETPRDVPSDAQMLKAFQHDF